MAKTGVAGRKQFGRLVDILRQSARIESACKLIGWDQEVMMPEGAVEYRADVLGQLRGMQHTLNTGVTMKRLVKSRSLHLFSQRSRNAAAVLNRASSNLGKARKLSASFVEMMAQVCSRTEKIWEKARAANDFALLSPWLEKVITLKRRQADLIGYAGSPYDVLLDEFEPDMTVAQIEPVLMGLRDFLVPFLAQVKENKQFKSYQKIPGFNRVRQLEINHAVAEHLRFDFSRGRLDASAHPFSDGVHPGDARMTTRYEDDDLLYSVMSTIHEVGHSLYEQGLPARWYGTCLGTALSFAVHEGISRLYENLVGRDTAFWLGWNASHSTDLQLPSEQIIASVQAVQPTLIRTEADEVTYNLHILIRYEIEKRLIEGSLSVKELPDAFNGLMMEYLGVQSHTDADGVMQDCHWPSGLFGYFPLYALGNLYSAQMFAAVGVLQGRSIFDFESLGMLKGWLTENIFRHASRYPSAELIRKATGHSVNARFWIEHIQNRYGSLLSKR